MNQLAVVDAMAVDYDHGQYRVTAEVFNTSAVPGPGKGVSAAQGANTSASVNLVGHGKTLSDAMGEVADTSSRHVFWAATQVVLIGTSALKRGLAPIVAPFLHYPEFRSTARMFAVPANAAHLLNATDSGLELTVGQEIRNIARFTHQDNSRGWAPRAYDVLRWNNQHGRASVLLGVRSLSPKTAIAPTLTMNTSAVIGPGGSLRGWLPHRDAPAYLWLTGRFRHTFMAVACPNGLDTTIYVATMGTRTVPDISGGHLNGLHLSITGSGKLAGQVCAPLTVINDAANRAVVSRTLATVHWAQKHQADIFGWGQAVYRRDPALWNTLNGHWPERFGGLPVSVTAQVLIVQGNAGRV